MPGPADSSRCGKVPEADVVWVLPAVEGGGGEGLRHPREAFDGLVAGQLGDVGGPDDGVGSEQRDERGRQAVAGGGRDIGGQAFEQRADPAAAVGQAPPGLRPP